ncbi:MAG TPA: hypothetical protein P5048_01790 [Chlamydiales bacterium]|nr:hypothetical protein [Chlamydiales bacterium]
MKKINNLNSTNSDYNKNRFAFSKATDKLVQDITFIGGFQNSGSLNQKIPPSLINIISAIAHSKILSDEQLIAGTEQIEDLNHRIHEEGLSSKEIISRIEAILEQWAQEPKTQLLIHIKEWLILLTHLKNEKTNAIATQLDLLTQIIERKSLSNIYIRKASQILRENKALIQSNSFETIDAIALLHDLENLIKEINKV